MDRGRLTTHPSSNQAPNGIAEVGQVSPRTGKCLGKKCRKTPKVALPVTLVLDGLHNSDYSCGNVSYFTTQGVYSHAFYFVEFPQPAHRRRFGGLRIWTGSRITHQPVASRWTGCRAQLAHQPAASRWTRCRVRFAHQPVASRWTGCGSCHRVRAGKMRAKAEPSPCSATVG